MGKEHIEQSRFYVARMGVHAGNVKYFNYRPKLVLPNLGRISLPVYHRLYLEMLSNTWEKLILCLHTVDGPFIYT